MAVKTDEFDYAEDDLGVEIEDEIEYTTAVDGIKWTAIKFDHPSDNEALRDYIESMGGMTIDAGRELFDELWDAQMMIPSAALKALQKLNEWMEDVETFNFAELVRYIEERTPLDMFYDHSQDMIIHITEGDRAMLALIPKLRSDVDTLSISLEKGVLRLTGRIEALESGQANLDSRLNVHIADSDAHSTPEQKAKLDSIIPDESRRLYTWGDGHIYEASDSGLIVDGYGTSAYTDGQMFVIQCNVTCTDSPMFKLNELDPVPILTLDGEQVRAGQFAAGTWVILQYSDALEAFTAHTNSYVTPRDLSEIAANFDNDIYMSGCDIGLDYSTKGLIVETAHKNGQMFAERTTDYSDRENIQTRVIFYLDGSTVGVEKTMHIGTDKTITTEIREIEFEGVG